MPCNCFRQTETQTKKQKDDRKTSKGIEKQIANWMKEYRKSIKILLLGAAESGKTTIIKQMKILHIKGFSEEERVKKAKEIRINLLEAIQSSLIGYFLTRLNESSPPQEITESVFQADPSFCFSQPENQENWNILRNIRLRDIENDPMFEFDDFFFAPISGVWSDDALQTKFSQLSGFFILDSAQYFLDKIHEIRKSNYSPCNADILRSRKRTTEIQKIEFEVKIPSKYGGGEQLFWMFDVGGQKGERRKWIQVFDGISAILFLVSVSEFDVLTRESSKQFVCEKKPTFGLRLTSQRNNTDRQFRENRMLDSLRLFRDICESRFLEFCGLICFLNKQDQLREKIVSRQVKMSDHFDDYDTFQYEPKVNVLTELGLAGVQDSRRYYLPFRLRTRGGKNISRDGSINSSCIALDLLGQPQNEPTTSDLCTTGEPDELCESTPSIQTRNSICSNTTKKPREDSLRSNDVRADADSGLLMLELEYRKARNFIKQKFVSITEEVADKRRKNKGQSINGAFSRTSQRECFFHYTVATDTDNIRTVFDDVQVMIILNNINQTILN